MKIVDSILLTMCLLEILSLSIVSVFDNTTYSGINHFIGFMSENGQWPFLIIAIIGALAGTIIITKSEKT